LKFIALTLALASAALAQQPGINYVVPAAGYYGKPASCGRYNLCATVAHDSLISIYGHNLATSTALATIYPWPTSLGGVSVLIQDNNPGDCRTGGPDQLRLLYVSPNQINALVSTQSWPPLGIRDITVSSTAGSAVATIEVDNTAPALFGLANNSAAALHANYQVVSTSNPAAPGEYLALYATGLAGAPGYGQSNPDFSQWLGKVTVSVDGIQARITFFGHAAGYDGLDQVNIQVPAGVHRGTSLPVTMTADDLEQGTTGCATFAAGVSVRTLTSNTVLLPIN
jgi:uncharacterized protein (TIGR03437 family)